MRVLIFGGKGQLGNDVVKLAPQDIEIIVPSKEEVDLTDKNQIEKFIKTIGSVDIIFYLAGYVKVDLAEDEPEKVFQINTVGIKNVLDCLPDTPVLYISTDYVFDGKKHGVPYYEDDLPNPINIYGLSKYAGEIVVKNYSEKYYIIRTASLYGKFPSSGKKTNFVYAIIKKAQQEKEIKVVNDIYMSPTYTYDLANKLWELFREKFPYGIYHLTNSGYCSWYEFAKTIVEIKKLDVEILPVSYKEYTNRAKRPLWSVLGTKKNIILRHWRDAVEEFLYNC